MDKFYFEIPSLERKDEIIEFLDEFVKNDSQINGAGSLDKIYDGLSFEEALEICLKMEDEEYAKSINRCPGKTFLLIRERDNRIVGSINLRWNLNEALLKHGGHIGYEIRPSERRKGYNKLNLYMVLKEAKLRSIPKVMLSCDEDNLGSNGTIKALGGVLERKDVYKDKPCNVYWIDVNESLENNKEIYEQYISNNK